MEIFYECLIWFTVGFHWFVITTITLGPILQLFHERLLTIFWTVFWIGGITNYIFEGCLLTMAEQGLRKLLGQSTEWGSFLCYYLQDVFVYIQGWFNINISPSGVDTSYLILGVIGSIFWAYKRRGKWLPSFSTVIKPA